MVCWIFYSLHSHVCEMGKMINIYAYRTIIIMTSVDKLIKLLRDIDENPPKKKKHRKLKSI